MTYNTLPAQEGFCACVKNLQEASLWVISWIIFGLIAGAIAKLIMPGNDGGGFYIDLCSWGYGCSLSAAGWRPCLTGGDYQWIRPAQFPCGCGGRHCCLGIFRLLRRADDTKRLSQPGRFLLGDIDFLIEMIIIVVPSYI